MRRVFPILFGATVVLNCNLMSDLEGAAAKPKAIKQIMKLQKAPLDKVKKGNATAGDKKKLLELYTDLGKNKPPRGDADNWKTRTETLVSATQDLVDGKDGAQDEFLKAVDCGKCHADHKSK